MSHKIIGISHSSNGDITKFIQLQTTRLAASHRGVSFETANQANEILTTHTDPYKQNRFPFFARCLQRTINFIEVIERKRFT